jgi:uncharacterized protein
MRRQRPTFLLDVNVLIALGWPNHPFHAQATRFMNGRHQWATCAITQLGFLRISLNPTVVGVKVSMADALGVLHGMVRDKRHCYLDSPVAPNQAASAFTHVLGHSQVTDAFLIYLASANKATFLTLDARLRGLPNVTLLAQTRA